MINSLANHVWQSTFFALAAALLTLAFRNSPAKVRYAIWLSSSIKFLIPFSLLVSFGGQLRSTPPPSRRTDVQIVAQSASSNIQRISTPFPPTGVPRHHSGTPVIAVSMWVSGFLVIAWLRFRSWRRIQLEVRTSTRADLKPLDLPTAVEARWTRGALEPGIVGVRRPLLLLPEGIIQQLTTSELQAVIAHELCHLRRRDNLFAIIHMAVEAMFWFHPLVWWIGGRLVEERERACDEEVVSLGNRPDVYADAIVRVCKLYVSSPLACVSGTTGADLRRRIEAIMSTQTRRGLTGARRCLLGFAAIASVTGPIATGVLMGIARPAVTRAQTESPRPLARGDSAVVNAHPASRVQSHKAPPRRPILFESIPEPPQPWSPNLSGPFIESIEFKGTQLPQLRLRAILKSRVGEVCDIETLRHDSQALYATGRFSNILLQTEAGSKGGVVVRFVVAERPLIESIELQGEDTVTVAEIVERFQQRNIQLKAKTLYNGDEVGLAAATVQELLAERGRRNVIVTPLLERIQPSNVKITFRAETKN